MKATFPLKDGDVIETSHGFERVAGEIKPPHREPVCWTLQGFWYRRRDVEEMTGWNGRVMTARVFYRLKRKGKL